ncbi:tripartite tricarboxylate transporter family receptor [Variibacter gotjawalensis]|uniref:Tripartite tricarboxylate transporter family receptor n=1 Tax=Variibacter gotjawalensis TaxID=1333996 RepID=A0A0S3PXS0_9BRAD|nr:tripartite tricarboxylate transporter substrate binding protein [Variibacter gotjawalensis]NIK46553.1 tripartite-type tricarboxylate transporter receptor subunit TctC [Variibacter gotjawalensis]RZS48458.1 tripartite-type tricarboxylate transporter receptor subunit TctC [Variibacter gotjawalensis]BAT60719.1 tripartite tricarboxylate transporter family receptor [Variibacter gotjawalensis]
MRKLVATCLAAAALIAPSLAQAEWVPNKPITIVVGFAPGGGSDVIARALQSAAQPFFPVPIIVLNKAGAAGTTAAAEVARGPADGYTMFVGGGSESTSVGAYRQLPYDIRKDFRPILRATSNPQLLVVAANSPYKTAQELIAKAKANPGTLNYGSSGPGSLVHATTEVFAKKADLKLQHVPYQGGGPALQAVVAGQIDFLISALDEVQGQLDGGTIRVLAVARPQRLETHPDVPTLRELGYDVIGDNMKGLVAAAGLPDDAYKFLHDNFKKGLDSAAWQEFATRSKFKTEYLDGPGFQKAMVDLFNEISAAVK